jgi:hypothetical protein
MSIIRHTLLAVCAALLSLVIVAVALSACAAASELGRQRPIIPPLGTAFIVFLYSLICGFVPTAFGIAPAFVILQRRGMMHGFYALALGVAPGAAALLIDVRLGLIAIVCGAAVAGLTYWLCAKFGLE